MTETIPGFDKTMVEAFDKFYNQGLDHAIETIKTAVKVNSLNAVTAHILIKAISTLKK